MLDKNIFMGYNQFKYDFKAYKICIEVLKWEEKRVAVDVEYFPQGGKRGKRLMSAQKASSLLFGMTTQ